MKKRVLAVGMMLVFVFASVLGVSAADSKTETVTESGASIGMYDLNEGDTKFAGVKAEVKSQMKDLEAKNAVSLNADVDKALKGKTLLVGFFDLIEVPGSDHTACATNGHKIELTVSALTSSCKNVVILHYSQVRDVWEVVDATADGNKLTFTLKDLSPVAIYADVVESAPQGTSPGTQGVYSNSTWMLWSAVALIVIGAGVVVSQKKRG